MHARTIFYLDKSEYVICNTIFGHKLQLLLICILENRKLITSKFFELRYNCRHDNMSMLVKLN